MRIKSRPGVRGTGPGSRDTGRGIRGAGYGVRGTLPVTRYLLSAFTLIELLIVIVIISFISLAIYATLSRGIDIWQRVSQVRVEEDVNIFLDTFSRDLKNAVEFSGIDFRGDKGFLEFPALCYNRQLKMNTPGKISYYYRDGLFRQARDISQVYDDKDGLVREALKDVKSLRFGYYIYDEEKKEYGWEEESPAGHIPLAVRLELELKDGAIDGRFVRTVSIPIGG